MHESLQNILNLIEQSGALTAGQKQDVADWAKQIDKAMAITEFKLDRTEKVKRTTAILLEETIEELEQKRKAVEAQNRELEVEAALERVRARTMGMHKSEELLELVKLLYKETEPFGVSTFGISIAIFREEENAVEYWFADNLDSNLLQSYKVVGQKNKVFRQIWEEWKKKSPQIKIYMEGDEKRGYDTFILEETEFSKLPEDLKQDIRTHKTVCFTFTFFKYGYFESVDLTIPNEENAKIIIRFAKVFEQTYTRFLDLQKAEAQAREAQIELSLERIRAQVTAMQESADLLDIVVTMRTEFVNLGHEAHYFWHMRWLPDRYEKAMTSGDGSRIGMVMTLPRHIHGDIERVADWEESDEPTYVLAMDTEMAVDYVEKMITLGDFEQVDPQAPTLDDVRHIGGLTFIMARTTHGEIGYSLPGVVPDPPKDAVDTLVRFASVFDLAYKRFEDLQKAEARAREAVQQASLDRVRAEIASMRSTDDLQRITPLIWRELTTLGVPFFRCGVFIIDEVTELTHAYLSTPFGEAFAALHMKFDSAPFIHAAVEHWRQQQVYREEWNREQFIAWTQSILKQGLIDSPEKYQAGGEAPEKLVLQFMPFTQGMLYIGSSAALSDDEIAIGRALANAFGVAYARYEDFQRLETAKAQVEAALDNLKKTQGQLVQAEKMASLGQLTAGIAHEIKNPLNFVNNFAALSVDLAKELREEIAKIEDGGLKMEDSGSRMVDRENFANIDDIVETLIQNAEKINHHGKRADGIVKSMMQHARGSSGQRELADINQLLDEAVNLTYHGLRANDASFNITIEKEYDETIGKLEVVPQDISRVFLNIMNNACYAAFQKQKANEKEKKASSDSFSPAISVSTKNLRDRIEIRIRDNGNGIPKDIREKIFNPFFTTKPTGQGTGLGLSISYDIIVQQHRGEIAVETEEGEFTEFVVRLTRV